MDCGVSTVVAANFDCVAFEEEFGDLEASEEHTDWLCSLEGWESGGECSDLEDFFSCDAGISCEPSDVQADVVRVSCGEDCGVAVEDFP